MKGPKILTTCLILAVAAIVLGGLPAAAEVRPSSDVLMPYFEVELQGTADQSRTSLFAICNDGDEPVDVLIRVQTNWGIPVLEVPITLQGDQVRTVNLRDWLVNGTLPDRQLSPAELDHLRAALSGRISPRDNLYYSFEVAPWLAVGSVRFLSQSPHRPDVLWGDSFVIDPKIGYAEGETLVDLDPTTDFPPECTRHGVRFLAGGGFDAGTELMVWTGNPAVPSASPDLADSKRVATTFLVYDEAGHVVDQIKKSLLPVERLKVKDFNLPTDFGWFDIVTESESFITAHYSASDRYSAALHAYCLPEELQGAGPGIRVDKLTNGAAADVPTGPRVPAGETVHWTYVVTNTGDVALTGIEVEDSDGVLVICPQDTLGVGESMTCTASGPAQVCQHANTAIVTALAPDGKGVNDRDTSHYYGLRHGELTLSVLLNGQVTTPPGPVYEPGTALTWTYEVTNSGDFALTGLTVADDHGIAVVCPPGELAPGATVTCKAEGKAQAGQHVYLATASAKILCGDDVTSQARSSYSTPGGLSLSIEKLVNGFEADTPPGPSIPVGGAVLWTYVVTNTSDVQLVQVKVTDSMGVAVTCPKTVLSSGESMTCTAAGTAQAGPYNNVGTVTAKLAGGASTVTASDPANYLGVNPRIALEKRVNGADADGEDCVQVLTGSTVQWSFVVTNLGDVRLTGVTVTDDRVAAVTCPKTTLEPGESMTCTASGTAINGEVRNLGTVTGTPQGVAGTVTATDPACYIGRQTSVLIEKLTNGQDADTAPGPTIPVGDPVLWTYVVTNTGDVALTQVAVTDDRGVTVTCPKTTLQPGESMTCTGNGTATAGQYSNIGTVTGKPSIGPNVTDTDPSHYKGQATGDQGCTPGYWKNHTDSWPPTGYSTGQKVKTVFTEAIAYPSGWVTLHEALSLGGGSGLDGAAEILLRAAVAALLNSAHPGVDYPRVTSQVIADVNNALASDNRDTMLVLAAALDADNNLGCPLN